MGFPFIRTPQAYIGPELSARKDSIIASGLKPWIMVTSNLGEGKTLSSLTYSEVIGDNNINSSYDVSGTPKYKPNPIISEFSIDFSNRGTLRKGVIKIQCFTIQQLEEMQKYFMEPGISLFVQWGWNHTGQNKKTVYSQNTNPETQRKFYRKGEELDKVRDSNNGCYDNMLGIISKAESSVSGEEFTITTRIVSLGEILYGKKPTDPSSKETDKEEALATPEKYSSVDISTARVNEKTSGKVNWMYFFNQLPDQFKIADIKGWGLSASEINPSTDFINYDEMWLEDVRAETGKQYWGLLGKNKFTFCEKEFFTEDDESPLSPKKYIKFSAFIALFNKILESLSKQKNNPNSFFKYKLNIGTKQNPFVLCGSFQDIFSCDDAVFIPNKEAKNWFNKSPYYTSAGPKKELPGPEKIDNSIRGADGSSVSFPWPKDIVLKDGDLYHDFKKFTVGWIGDLYIDNDLAMEAIRNTDKSIKDTLDSLLSEMSDATAGMWDFQCIEENSDGYKLHIVDANLINPKNDYKPLELFYHGPNSVFLDANFNFDIPKGLASSVVMKKANPKTVSTTTGLTSLFSDKKDRVLTDEFLQSLSEDKSQPKAEKSKPDDLENWKGFRRESRILIQPELSKKRSTTGVDISNYLVPGISTNNELFNSLRKIKIGQGSDQITSSGPLPIKINFTVLGISGFRFGDKLKIYGLPSQYSDPNKGSFMVIEVKHKVDNKLWTTEVECQYRPYIVT